MSDDLDQPEPEGMTIAVPFVACQSKGGPYDDDAFTAGFRAGEVFHALTVAAANGSTAVAFPMTRSALLAQLELIAMHCGFPVMEARVAEQWPEWCDVTFARGKNGL